MDSIAARACEEFSALSDRAYLDAACIGVASRSAARAVCGFAHRVRWCPEESGTAHHGRLNGEHAAARALAARLIGADEADVALVESTTHGLTIAAQALPLEAGDQVAVGDLEFIQAAVAWSHLSRRDVTIRRIAGRDGTIPADLVREHLADGARVLAISSVQWTSGFRADLAAISDLCHRHGAWLVVDAAQHLGALPFDVTETPVDVLACGGHKWLNSPFGRGLLYLSPRVRERLRPPAAGFFAADPPAGSWGEAFLDPGFSPFQPLTFTRDARAWEVGGTPNYPGAIGLAAGLRLLLDVGPDRVAAHISTLTDRLIDGLDRLGVTLVSPREPRHRAGIVTFTVGPGAADADAMRRLLDAGVAVSVRYSSGVGGVRVSCHYFNTPDDVDRLLDVLRSRIALHLIGAADRLDHPHSPTEDPS